MMIKRKKCKQENCQNQVWGKGLCKFHQIKKPKNEEEVNETIKMWNFFLSIWKERKHYSEISQTPLGKEPLSIYFHHVLPKEIYERFSYYKKNIILVTGDEHQNLHSDIYKYEKVNKLREELLKEYFNN